MNFKNFVGKVLLEEDGTQNFLVFQPLSKDFQVIANAEYA